MNLNKANSLSNLMMKEHLKLESGSNSENMTARHKV